MTTPNLRPGTSLLVASLLALAACSGGGGSTQHLLDGSSYVAIPRSVEPAATGALRTAALRTLASPQLAAGSSFYLAVKRTELTGKFFLAGYMNQVFPDAIKGGGAKTIGTRVVAMRLEPDRLVLFDASDVKATSDVLDPTLIVEAWPVVSTSQEFNADPRRGEYVLVDPSAGLNQFTVVSTEKTEVGYVSFHVSLAWLQDFERLDDGAAFRLVFSGETSQSVHLAKPENDVESDPLRLSGTLGVALRHYAEGEGFEPPPTPEKSYFFLSEPRLVRNTGLVEKSPAAWNVHEGMTPIRWTISPYLRTLARDPLYGKYDLEGAIRKGIENWNEVFGYPVLEAVVGEDGARPDDDVTNYVWLDPDVSVSSAFADWRMNPNTGEVRGASVYFGVGYVNLAIETFDPATPPPVAPPADSGATGPGYLIGWAGMTPVSLCDRPFGTPAAAAVLPAAVPAVLTPKQKVEAYVTGVILHEIGHTLGLRHNFKGSLAPPSSSIMEYIVDADQIYVTTPQRYDAQALEMLYQGGETLPEDPFCTDEDQEKDAECLKYDQGTDPLVQYFGPEYDALLANYLSKMSDATPGDGIVNGLLGFVRAGKDSAQRTRAYHLAFDLVSGIVEPAPWADPDRVNEWIVALSRRLWLSEKKERGELTMLPPLGEDAALARAVAADQGGWVRNLNGVATFPSRRLAVDVLKKAQVDAAYEELLIDQAALQGSVPVGTTPPPLVADLLARIGAAVNPYYQ